MSLRVTLGGTMARDVWTERRAARDGENAGGAGDELAPVLALLPEQQVLGASERFFVSQHRAGATNLTRVVMLESPPPPAIVARALRIVALRHRPLRARVAELPAPAFLHGRGVAPQLHVVPRVSDGQFEHVLRSVVNTPMDLARGPLCALHYVYAEGAARAELIVAADHVVCDGVSINALCAEVLELCAGAAPRPATRPLPVLEELLPRGSLAERAGAIAASVARFANIHLRRWAREPRPVARCSDFVYAELGFDDTAQLIARARSASSSVTAALIGATLLSMREVRPTARLAASVPVDLRPRLRDSALTPDDLANLTSAIYLDTRARAPMWTLARVLKKRLDREIRGTRFLHAAMPIYQLGSALTRGPRPTLAHVMVSNSGPLPLRRDYGAFRVVGFRSATSAPMLAADVALFCNTLSGRLCINLLFAPEVVSRPEAAQILARVRAHLLESP